MNKPIEKPVKNPSAKAFVAEIMLIVGAEKPRDLSRMLGWEATDRETRLFAWARGDAAPNHEGTLALLHLAKLIKGDGGPTGRELISATGRARESLARQPDDPLEALRVTVEEQGKAMTKALKALERANRDLARRLPPEVQPAKKAANS